jgi:geranylgeranyl transferase type-2 subunit beta
MPNYLADLHLRLARGIEALDEDLRLRHAQYLRDQQRADGGFSGREGPSDMYYTSFGLRGLALLGELRGEVAARAGEFLRARLSGEAPIVDFLSLIFAAALVQLAAGVDVFAGKAAGWREATASALENMRRPDGGYAKTAEGQTSSLYHTFLVVVCLEVLGLPIVGRERLIDFVRSRRREDGGFVEMSPMKRSGTNPTAAAVGLLKILAALDPVTRQGTIEFVSAMQTEEGGLRANTRIPIADLLSTFTGTLTLADLAAPQAIDLAAGRRYAESLQVPAGGFHGAAWDTGADVDYTFYGLATLALLAAAG